MSHPRINTEVVPYDFKGGLYLKAMVLWNALSCQGHAASGYVKGDGFKYYEYFLCYVGDVLCISHVPLNMIDGIKAVFKLKGGKAETPEMYLGAILQKVINDDDRKWWIMSLENDLDTAINNLEEKLANHELKLPNRCDTTLYSNYHPSEETTVELDANGVQYFKDIIVVLRWAVELGRVKLFL